MNARLVIRERVIFDDGHFVEMVVWEVPQPVPPSLHRFKYRLVYIVDGQRILGFDNERGKGDHAHRGGSEQAMVFPGIDELLARFVREVQEFRSRR